MASARPDEVKRAETILAEAIQPLVAELRLIDAADFIAFIRLERFSNVCDLVNSSIEPFFSAGALAYAFGAEYMLDWTSPPTVILDLEFQRLGVDVFFKLSIEATTYRVVIDRYVLDSACPDRLDVQLQKALAHARLAG